MALARDGEFDASYYEELYAEYARAAAAYGWQVISTANRSPEQVKAEVERVLRLAGVAEEATGGAASEVGHA